MHIDPYELSFTLTFDEKETMPRHSVLIKVVDVKRTNLKTILNEIVLNHEKADQEAGDKADIFVVPYDQVPADIMEGIKLALTKSSTKVKYDRRTTMFLMRVIEYDKDGKGHLICRPERKKDIQ